MSVADFTSRLAAKRAAAGESSFLLCRCQEQVEEPAGMFPVVLHDVSGPFIVALVCAACGEAINVSGGRPED